jgi:hypothetical protein
MRPGPVCRIAFMIMRLRDLSNPENGRPLPSK